MIDLEDAEAVFEYCQDATDQEDAQAIRELLEVTLTVELSAQMICNVLTATLWEGARQLNAMLGWKNFVPAPDIVGLRQRFVVRAVEWVDKHEPSRKYGLLCGLVPDEMLGPKPQGTSA